LLTEALSDADPTIRIAAARGLGWFGPAAMPALDRLEICWAQAGTNRHELEAIGNAIEEVDHLASSKQELK
jgi:hypothetical protein